MNEHDRDQSALGPYRVLDLADEKGVLCAKILADMGADVIKIEPPGGDPTRRLGPFYHEEADPEKSLFWFTFNTSKRSITLDITKREGQDLLKRLVRTADFLVECFPPGYLDRLGLGYTVLSTINPRLVMTSITNFGQSGPYRDYKSSDLIGTALGGLMNICGEPERPPVRMRASQTIAQAGAQAAVGTLIAHHYRQLTGEGQHVDVSVQEAVSMGLDFCQQWWDLNKVIFKRLGAFRGLGGRHPARYVFACKDGYATSTGLTVAGPAFRAMVGWMASEGMAEDLDDPRWLEKEGPLQPEESDHALDVIARFVSTKPKMEVFLEAEKRRIIFMPINTAQDLLEDPQLKFREFFVEVEHPEMGDTITYPGAPFKMGESPWRIWQRPPLIGEHNEEIYLEELGLSNSELATLRRGGVV